MYRLLYRFPAVCAALTCILLVLGVYLFFVNTDGLSLLDQTEAEKRLQLDPLTADDSSREDLGSDTRVERAEQTAENTTELPPAFVVSGTLRSADGQGIPADVDLYLSREKRYLAGGKPTPAQLFGAMVEGLDVEALCARRIEPPASYVAQARSDAEGRYSLALTHRPTEALYLWVVDDIWSAANTPQLGLPSEELLSANLDLELIAGACLSGRAVDESGQGLAGTTLLLRDVPAMRIPSGMSPDSFPPPQRIVTCDAEGKFRIEAIMPFERYVLRGVHGTGAEREVGEQAGIQLTAGEREEIALVLSRGREVLGTIEDSEGKPIAGAEVIAIPAHSSFSAMEASTDPASATTRSLADGSFVIRGLLPSLHLVLAEGSGYEPSRSVPADLSSKERVVIKLTLNSGFDLRGIVKDAAGKAARGTEVVLVRTLTQNTFMSSTGRPLLARRTISDGEGRFAFDGLEDSSFELIASAADGQSGARKNSITKKQLAKEIVLELTPFGAVRGVVLSAAQVPVERFEIEIQRRVMMGFLPATVARAEFFDKQGRFEMSGLAPGKYVLLVRVPDRAVHTLPEVEISAVSEPMQIVLSAVTSVSGIVVTPKGVPIAGAEVAIAGDLFAAIAREMSLSSRKAITDEAGQFKLSGLPVGEIALQAKHPLYAPSEAIAITLVPEVVLEGQRLELGSGGIIEGTVYNSEGLPEMGTAVMASHGPMQLEQVQTETDAEGHYRLEGIAPGTVSMIAMGVEGVMDAESVMSAMRMQNIRILADQTLVVDFGEPTGMGRGTRLFGTLTENGKPKKNTMILAACSEEGGEESASQSGRLRFATSDRKGDYEFKNLPPGACSLSIVQFQNGGQSVVEFEMTVLEQPEQRHDLSLDSGSLSGRIRSTNGENLANVQVVLLAAGVSGNEGFRAFVMSGEDGRYRFDGLAEGRYRATAGGPSFFGNLQNRSSRTREDLVIVAGREVSEVNFELAAGAILVGRLTDATGKGVAGASLEARPALQDTIEKSFFQGLSGPDGRYRVSGIEPGVATVRVTKRGYAGAQEENVLFQAGRETNLDLRIEEGVRLRVRVVDEANTPLANASGRVFDANGKSIDSLISFEDLIEFAQGSLATGVLELGSYAPGDYKIKVDVEGRTSQELPVRLRRQAEGLQELTITVPRG